MHALYTTRDEVAPSRLLEAFPDLKRLGELNGASPAEAHEVIWVLVTHADDIADLRGTVMGQHGLARVVVMSNDPRPQQALEVFKAGAHGYCHAQSTPKLFRRIAKAVGNGGIWVGPEFMPLFLRGVGAALDKVAKPKPVKNMDALTEREREVSSYVCKGASNKEIARTLGITERTIKAHLTSIFGKLGIRDRVQLVIRLKPVLFYTKNTNKIDK